ncbi:MAG: tetratricopeptide repeat protein, partial [Pseudomonadota bacterium]
MTLTRRSSRLLSALLLAAVTAVAACDDTEDRVKEHFERGLELVEEGESEKAMLEFKNAIRLDENHAESHYQMGLIEETRDNLPESFRRYSKVVDIQPENVEARLKLTRLFMVDNAPDRALKEIDVITRLEPDRAETYALLAAVHLGMNQLEAAKEALDKAIALDPADPDAIVAEASYLFRTDKFGEALAKVNAALVENPKTISLHLTKIQTLERIGDTQGVGEHLKVIIETFPKALEFRLALVNWAIRNDEADIAEAELRELVSRQPGERKPIFDLIRFLRVERGDGAAREALVELVKAAAEPFPLQLMLAQFDVEIGDPQRAIDDLSEMIVAEEPGNANRARVALARIQYNEGKPELADQLVRDTLLADERDVEALVLLTARQIDDGDLEAATQTVRRGLEEAPEDIRLLQLAGRAQELAGNLDLANDRLASAVRAARFDATAVERYVQFLMRTVRFTAAETVLSEAIQRNQGNAQLIDLLGFTRLRLQNWLGAEEAAQALDTLNPERAKQLRAAILLGQER